jgi:hypothetical protein
MIDLAQSAASVALGGLSRMKAFLFGLEPPLGYATIIKP